MKIVLDTNVFVSGVFYTGPPYQVLEAWRDGQIQLVVSPEILLEYAEVGERLAERFEGVDLASFLRLVAANAQIVAAPELPQQVCDDPDDDMFLACALAGGATTVVTGDRALLRTNGYRGIQVVTPRAFLREQLGGGA
ncbi:MAG: putative toxin-antitoxin system toxin component, PIN family [Spirochaetaceae bacterium]|nr:putative toxin-antitoxin system toxin component, PIN family [Spirochaetaceae bacterium]